MKMDIKFHKKSSEKQKGPSSLVNGPFK